MYRLVRSTTVFVATVVVGTALFGTLAATADPPADPVAGDDRATAYPGNVVEADCPTLFPGSTSVALTDLTFSVDATGTYLDITAVDADVEVAGVVVKGGPAYNVYEVADLGDLAWLDLHSPLVSSGAPAQISHWFACGVTTSTTTTTTTTTTSTSTSTTTSGTTTTTSGEQATSSTPGATTTTTTPAAVSPAASDDDLATTGFAGAWLLGLAAALLLGGGALLIVLRTRGARR
jgi:hypothetical protein